MTQAVAATPPEPRPSWPRGLPETKRRAQPEVFWSPTPITGYRMWYRRINNDREWRGARVAWRMPTMRAECGRTGQPGSPHLRSQRLCHGLCGINAFSTPEALVAAAGVRLTARSTPHLRGRQVGGITEALFGAVTLTGRVVEHEDGYRGANARVIALVRWHCGALWATDDPDRITAEFVDGTSDYDSEWQPIAAEHRTQIIASELRRLTPHATGT